MSEFEGIRPYNDAEVPAVLQRLLADQELMRMLAAYRLPKLNRLLPGLSRRVVQAALRREARGVTTVEDLQHRLEPYLDRLIERSTLEVTYSGLDQLSATQPHLFIANHRDIVMDPAFVNYALYNISDVVGLVRIIRYDVSYIIYEAADGIACILHGSII